jgi:hypothetical protein
MVKKVQLARDIVRDIVDEAMVALKRILHR